MSILTKIKNKIRDTAKVAVVSNKFDLANRTKLVLSCFFPRQTKLFFPFSTPEGIRVKKKSEISVYVDDFIYGDVLEPAYISRLKSKSSPVIVDLGCNTGLVAEYWMRLNPNTRYYAFDMMKECILAAQDRLSKYKTISYFDCALGDENKNIDISYDGTMDSSNSLTSTRGKTKRTVLMRRLDDIQEIKDIKEIDLLKIDVEGFEEPVLSGAIKTLEKSQYIVIELHLPKHCEDYSEIAGALLRSGHILYKVKSRNLYFKK
ncbi:MAG: FkbM family methyltransferase [Candidatus Liptonbacteria bacterium]|nr:FkbM family methyltransferase [Candidatus Liptonbacteria bacterium]